jgi:hypothetical protein
MMDGRSEGSGSWYPRAHLHPVFIFARQIHPNLSQLQLLQLLFNDFNGFRGSGGSGS